MRLDATFAHAAPTNIRLLRLEALAERFTGEALVASVRERCRYASAFSGRTDASVHDEIPPRTERRHRACLFGLAGPNRFAQCEQGARQIEICRFIGQHGQTL
jgi:hypothetical protein